MLGDPPTRGRIKSSREGVAIKIYASKRLGSRRNERKSNSVAVGAGFTRKKYKEQSNLFSPQSEYGNYMYQTALVHTRKRRYSTARAYYTVLEQVCPSHVRAWVSHAQMEKKESRSRGEEVLRTGLRANPRSPQLLQAWGLHLLQEESEQKEVMAYGLLDLATQIDPSLMGVMKWKRVRGIGDGWETQRRKRRHERRRAMKIGGEN